MGYLLDKEGGLATVWGWRASGCRMAVGEGRGNGGGTHTR